MLCCPNCFGDSFLDEHIPKISSIKGLCDYCSKKDVPLVEPNNLIDYFQSVCSIYKEDDSINGKSLLEWFKHDWQILNKLDQIKAFTLLSDILNDDQIHDKKFFLRDYPIESAVEIWALFREEIISKNRFFFHNELKLNNLGELFKICLSKDESMFDGYLFRARIQSGYLPIPIEEMGKPKAKESKNGRANPVGISYLYTASTPETAVAETRPHPGDVLSVVKFSFSEHLLLLDLQNPRRSVSPFSIEENEVLKLRHDLDFLCHLGNELSKPILPREADLEYIPTQYLSEFVKNCGYDGIVFNSSISNGVNVTLFDDKKVNAEKVTQYKVTSLKYESIEL